MRILNRGTALACHAVVGAHRRFRQGVDALRGKIAGDRGQGTTEYAILVGVLTELDNVLGKKHEVRGLPCFR